MFNIIEDLILTLRSYEIAFYALLVCVFIPFNMDIYEPAIPTYCIKNLFFYLSVIFTFFHLCKLVALV